VAAEGADVALTRGSKLCSLADAARVVRRGDSVALGLCLEASIPFAFGHELIRQGIDGLTLVGPISDALFDQLIGAGCADEVVAAWVGNVSAGLGHNYRRACERGEPRPLRVRDHSNYSLALALFAGAHGLPYVPTRTLLGSDLLDGNADLELGEWEGEPVVRVRALRPDVAILHVQRASVEGQAHLWGNLGLAPDAALAARQVVLVAEEIVPREELVRDPNRVPVSPHKVVAVAEEPRGAHPSPVAGYYGRDHGFFADYHRASRDPDGFRGWLDEWVLSVPDRAAYLRKLGK
jgi:glutaconate CoA-transferase subunit A